MSNVIDGAGIVSCRSVGSFNDFGPGSRVQLIIEKGPRGTLWGVIDPDMLEERQ